METNPDFWTALDRLIENSDIIIDRPKGTSHPKFPEFIYKADYGYLSGTASMDGGGIDVWVGTEEREQADAIICIVDLLKRDSEIKSSSDARKRKNKLFIRRTIKRIL